MNYNRWISPPLPLAWPLQFGFLVRIQHIFHQSYAGERSPLSMARALQGRCFAACSDSPVLLRVHSGTPTPIFQAKLSFLKPLQGKETTGSLCCWKLHSSRFSDHTPTPGYLPVEANKCFDWRQAGDCRDKKLLRSCLGKFWPPLF